MNLFKYKLLTTLRTKELMFFSLAFPIILGSLFYLAFGNLATSETFDIVNIFSIVSYPQYLFTFFLIQSIVSLSILLSMKVTKKRDHTSSV